METFKNLLSLPVVKAAVDKVTDAYNKLKCSSSLVKESVDKVECVVNEVKVSVSPITKELEGPVKAIDKFVCKSLVFIEKKFPVLKEQPEVMYGALKNFIEDTVTPTVKTTLGVVSECKRMLGPIAGFALNQANKMAAVVDVLARSSEKVIDYFFAKKEDEYMPNGYEVVSVAGSSAESGSSAQSDVGEEPLPKVVETAETLGRVGLKLARAGFIVSTTPLRWTLSWLVCKRDANNCTKSEIAQSGAASTLTSGTSSLSSGSLDKAKSVSQTSLKD